jgi:hypothetical protein
MGQKEELIALEKEGTIINPQKIRIEYLKKRQSEKPKINKEEQELRRQITQLAKEAEAAGIVVSPRKTSL